MQGGKDRKRETRILLAVGVVFVLVLLVVSIGLWYRSRSHSAQQAIHSAPGEGTESSVGGLMEEELQTEAYEHNYWSHTELPEMTLAERLKVAASDEARGQAYVQQSVAKAQELSGKLEDYVRRWLRGDAPARLPKGLLPEYIDNPKTRDWTLVRPEEADPARQWLIIPSHEVDPEFKKLYMLGTDPHVTYGKLIFVAPIGSRLLVEGDFPHARYMDFEILPPFDPKHPASGTMGETPEVPIVDADIEPDQGNTNPFRVGADRNAPSRHYHLSFDLQVGNAVQLNPQAMKSPEYRAPGNNRAGGPFGFAGPWGDDVLTPSLLWWRVYAPDLKSDIYGGVSLPRATLQLDTGEQFWLQPDFSLARERQTTRVPAGDEAPKEPFAAIGPRCGWFKIFGLVLCRAERAGYLSSEPYGPQSPERTRERIREAFLLLFDRGENAEPPGDYEGSATACKNNDFLTRMFQLGPGKVYVITGKMPAYPKTRDGEPAMTGGEVRYWSISQYGSGEGDKYETAVNYGSLMDDEVVLNNDNEYVIVYSTPDNRPKNATARNGVTWANWGPRSRQTLTVRWMNVMPEWHLARYAPDEYNLPWARAAWSGTQYDESLVGLNRPGTMGPYHPVIHYMSKEEFEALRENPSPRSIPEWK